MALDDDGAVFATFRSELVRYATALVGPSEAEDVVMTVVGRAVRKVHLAELDNPKGYLLRGILNEARGRGRRRTTISLEGDLEGESSNGLAEVIDVLMSLPVRQRAAIYLHYWERAPINEIAQAMGVGSGTVKRYLHLARQKLKEVL